MTSNKYNHQAHILLVLIRHNEKIECLTLCDWEATKLMSTMATSDPLIAQIQLSNASEKTHARVAMF